MICRDRHGIERLKHIRGIQIIKKKVLVCSNRIKDCVIKPGQGIPDRNDDENKSIYISDSVHRQRTVPEWHTSGAELICSVVSP